MKPACSLRITFSVTSAFVAAAAELQAALEKDDATAGAKPAHDTHEAQHDLSASAYNYLAGKAGIPQTKSED